MGCLLPSAVQIGILPYAGGDIACFEILKDRLREVHDGRPPPAAIFGAGMLSSCCAQFVSYPLALVRTRLQVRRRPGYRSAHLSLTGHDDASIRCQAGSF